MLEVWSFDVNHVGPRWYRDTGRGCKLAVRARSGCSVSFAGFRYVGVRTGQSRMGKSLHSVSLFYFEERVAGWFD